MTEWAVHPTCSHLLYDFVEHKGVVVVDPGVEELLLYVLVAVVDELCGRSGL